MRRLLLNIVLSLFIAFNLNRADVISKEDLDVLIVVNSISAENAYIYTGPGTNKYVEITAKEFYIHIKARAGEYVLMRHSKEKAKKYVEGTTMNRLEWLKDGNLFAELDMKGLSQKRFGGRFETSRLAREGGPQVIHQLRIDNVMLEDSGVYTAQGYVNKNEKFEAVTYLLTVYKECDVGWESFENRCYKPVGHTSSWRDALAMCAEQGAVMASSNHALMNAFLLNVAQGHYQDDHEKIWLSGNDIAHQGAWVWGDGDYPVPGQNGHKGYSNWAPGHPYDAELWVRFKDKLYKLFKSQGFDDSVYEQCQKHDASPAFPYTKEENEFLRAMSSHVRQLGVWINLRWLDPYWWLDGDGYWRVGGQFFKDFDPKGKEGKLEGWTNWAPGFPIIKPHPWKKLCVMLNKATGLWHQTECSGHNPWFPFICVQSASPNIIASKHYIGNYYSPVNPENCMKMERSGKWFHSECNTDSEEGLVICRKELWQSSYGWYYFNNSYYLPDSFEAKEPQNMICHHFKAHPAAPQSLEEAVWLSVFSGLGAPIFLNAVFYNEKWVWRHTGQEVTSIGGDRVNDGWIRHNDYEYKLFQDSVTRDEAQKKCRNDHYASLFTPRDVTENEYMRNYVYKKNVGAAWLFPKGKKRWTKWINEYGKETKWHNLFGSVGGCAVLDAGEKAYWWMVKCDEKFPYICYRSIQQEEDQGWIKFNNKLYKLFETKRKHLDAKTRCINEMKVPAYCNTNGHWWNCKWVENDCENLMNPSTKQEIDFIRSLSFNFINPTVWIRIKRTTYWEMYQWRCWDVDEEHWTKEERVSWWRRVKLRQFWAEGQPAKMSEKPDCASLNTVTGLVSTQDCGSLLPYVCVKPLNDAEPWVRFENKLYKLFDSQQFTDSVYEKCRRQGASPAFPYTVKENEFLLGMSSRVTQAGVWINLRYLDGPNAYWRVGGRFEFQYDGVHQHGKLGGWTNWAPGFPKIKENLFCVRLDKTTGKWHQQTCSGAAVPWFPFVCVKSASPDSIATKPYIGLRHFINKGKISVKMYEESRLLRPVCQRKVAQCPPGWKLFGEDFGNKCYFFLSESLSWEDAQKRCQQFEGNLATSRTVTENEFLYRLARMSKTQGQSTSFGSVWLRGRRKSHSGKYRWRDDWEENNMEWTNWLNEPWQKSCINQLCICLVVHGSRNSFSLDCVDQRDGILDKNPVKFNFDRALSTCASMGGSLPRPKDKFQDERIRTLLTAGNPVWIKIKRDANGKLVWPNDDNERKTNEISYDAPWAIGQRDKAKDPNNPWRKKESCTVMGVGGWQVTSCDEHNIQKVMCELPQGFIDTSREGCLQMSEQNGKWQDADCTESTFAICEKSVYCEDNYNCKNHFENIGKEPFCKAYQMELNCCKTFQSFCADGPESLLTQAAYGSSATTFKLSLQIVGLVQFMALWA